MPRKVISIITPHFTPEITAAAHRMEAAANILASSFKVHVFTLHERGNKSENSSIKMNENLIVHYTSVLPYNKSVFIIRAFFEWWYSMKLLRKSNIVHADLAIVTIPFMFLLPIVARTCNAKKKIADIRDIVWDYIHPSFFIGRIIKKKITSVMHRALMHFDSVTVTNEGEKQWLMNHTGLSENKISIIPNGISKDKFKQLSEVKYMPHPHKFTISYIGNIGSSQQFYTLIDAVKDMNDIRLNLVGEGNKLKNIRTYVTLNKIKNVFIHGKLRWLRVVPYYQTSDLLFASLKDGYDTAIPSKLYEYLSTGLPILYQGKGSAADFLSGFKNTFVVNGSDSLYMEKLIWRIKKLSLSRSGVNIHIVGNKYIREKSSKQFVELSARLLNEKIISDVFVEDFLLSTNY